MEPKTNQSPEETSFKLLAFNYIKSQEFQRIVHELISAYTEKNKIEGIKSSRDKKLQFVIVTSVIIASSVLSYFGKFDTSLGVVFGTLVGYIFGKK